MTETRLREEICRLRPLAVRARADAGIVGQHQRETRRRRLAGDADQRLARLSRPGADVAARRRRQARLRRCPDQGSAAATPRSTRPATPARAVVHLHSTHSVALSMLPEIDPRAALPPMTPYYLMKCGLTALVPYYRPGDPAVADAIKGLAGKYSSVLLANHGPVVSGDSLEAAVFAIEELERDGEAVSAAARAQSALSVAAAGQGFDQGVWIGCCRKNTGTTI